MDIIFIIVGMYLFPIISAWLIGRYVFSSLNEKPQQAANAQALLVALLSFALIQIGVAFVFGMFFSR